MRGILIVAVLLALAGCRGGPAKQILGSWRPDVATDASAAAQARTALVFRSDKSFSVGDSVQGKYKMDGRRVTLLSKKILGRDAPLIPGAAAPRVGELSEDGKTLKITDESTRLSVEFVKSRS